MLPCRDSALCLSVHAVPGFVGTWLPNRYRTFGSLALGCPTHYLAYGSPRSGTWLPNSTFWHLVAQLYAVLNSTTCYFVGTWVPNTCYDQLRCTFFFYLAGRASSCCDILCDIYYYMTLIIYPAAICDTLWTSDTSCTCSGSTVCVHFIIIIHCSL